MPKYRLRADPPETREKLPVPWLQQGEIYHGIALLSLMASPKVRLFRPEGGASVDVPKEDVARC